jgi:hypothetical protein
MKFRKKPVVVEAEQFQPETEALPFADKSAVGLDEIGWYVTTAHGHRTPIAPGDWIIPEPDGRGFYSVKADIFENTYEPIPEAVKGPHPASFVSPYDPVAIAQYMDKLRKVGR